MVFKAVTCLIVGYIFSLIGFKKIMIPLLILQILLMCILAFSKKETVFYNYMFNGAFYFYVIVQETNVIATIAAVPKTFGIKYGSSVLCLVLCSKFISMLIAYLIHDTGLATNIIIILLNVLALIVCSHFPFNEELDIGRLVDRDLMIFKNFGLPNSRSLIDK